jgi:hypothetical protein
LSTNVSGITSWLPALEFLKRADPRTVSDLCSDLGIRNYTNPDGQTINNTLLAADANLAAALSEASGEFESYVFRGERYTLADIQLLTTPQGTPPTTTNVQAFIYGLITRIVKMRVIDRRIGMDPEAKVPEWYKSTQETLNRIAHGDLIFGLLEVQEAGLPEAEFMTEHDIRKVKMTSTVARPLFGRRAKDMHHGWGTGIPGQDNW